MKIKKSGLLRRWNEKKEKRGNDRSTLDAVSGILKIGHSAVLHVKIGLDDGC